MAVLLSLAAKAQKSEVTYYGHAFLKNKDKTTHCEDISSITRKGNFITVDICGGTKMYLSKVGEDTNEKDYYGASYRESTTGKIMFVATYYDETIGTHIYVSDDLYFKLNN